MAKHLFDSVDADWAWQAWQPTPAEKRDASLAAHFWRRAGFGGSPANVRDFMNRPIQETIELASAPSMPESSFEKESAALASAVLATNDAKQLAGWWLHRMLNSPAPIVEKTTLFWHGHFATSAEKVQDGFLMIEQNRMLRSEAMGDFRKIVHGISKDPAMLIYLDSAVNRKSHPNENFARELMELFCLGEGNYSEKDVQELARCFTGWEVRRSAFRFNSYQHDEGLKSLLGRDRIESGEQAIDVVLESPAAANFIATKLFRFFVADEPQPTTALLEPIAAQLRSEGWNHGAVVKRILGSRLMFSKLVRGRKVRSPIEFAMGWLKCLDATTNLRKLSEVLTAIGQSVFYPPNVKGWDGGRAWINSSTLVARANLLPRILGDEATRFGADDLETFLKRQGVVDADSLMQWANTNLLAVPLSSQAKQRIASVYAESTGTRKLSDPLVLIAGLAEMQVA